MGTEDIKTTDLDFRERRKKQLTREIWQKVRELERLDMVYTQDLCKVIKHWKEKRRPHQDARYPTPDGDMPFYKIMNADGKIVRLISKKYGDFIRIIMGMPRDGKWRRIMETRGATKKDRSTAQRRIRYSLTNAGYDCERVDIRWEPAGLVVKWRQQRKG